MTFSYFSLTDTYEMELQSNCFQTRGVLCLSKIILQKSKNKNGKCKNSRASALAVFIFLNTTWSKESIFKTRAKLWSLCLMWLDT